MRIKEKELMEEIHNRFHILQDNFGFHPQVAKDFDNSIINKSETQRIGKSTIGALYWLSEEEKAMVKRVEEDLNIKVYHVMTTNTEFGEMYSLLYVSEYTNDWEMDHDDLQSGMPLAYAFIAGDDLSGDMGYIQIAKGGGGLVRTQ